MTIYSQHYSKRETPQTEQASPDQVRNSAGGYTFKVSPMEYARRFLILGSESPTYYVSAKKLTIDNSRGLEALWREQPEALANLIHEVSDKALAPKNDPALWALALGAASSNPIARKIALGLLPKVARTSTHLFHFLEMAQAHRGWGHGLKKAVARWYEKKSPDALAMQAIKYRQRDGWTHRDALRLSHPSIEGSEKRAAIYDFICRDTASKTLDRLTDTPIQGYLNVLEAAKADDVSGIVDAIEKYKLPWEAVPTDYLNKKPVLEVLAPHLGQTALIRNLGRYTEAGLLAPFSALEKDFIARLTDVELLKAGRIHPMQCLVARGAYSAKQDSNKRIAAALEDAFQLAFATVEPANKRTMLALDISGSMGSPFMRNNAMTCAEATGAMSMITMQTEPECITYGFSDSFIDLKLTVKDSLDSIMRKIRGKTFSGTDCALPMQKATAAKWQIDTFVVYTDNETWAGKIHPHQALEMYRQQSGIDAKLVVVGMVTTEFTIANPADKGMLDVVGFDATAPAMISKFSAGAI